MRRTNTYELKQPLEKDEEEILSEGEEIKVRYLKFKTFSKLKEKIQGKENLDPNEMPLDVVIELIKNTVKYPDELKKPSNIENLSIVDIEGVMKAISEVSTLKKKKEATSQEES